MNIQTSQNNININQTNRQPAFKSRNAELKELDNISRLIRNEFPLKTTTKLAGYKSINSKREFVNYFNYLNNAIVKVREFYTHSKKNKKILFRELDTLKRTPFGNCTEYADATATALKLNGYKDVDNVWLYAYNTKTKKMRKLDHVSTCIHLEKPKGYKPCPLEFFDKSSEMPEKYRLYPNRNTIFIDTWSGICDYGKNMKETYNHNKSLIRCANKSDTSTLLKENEELCFVPFIEKLKLKKDDFKYLETTYPQLMLSKNRSEGPLLKPRKLAKYKFIPIDDFKFLKLKSELRLKNAPTAKEIEIIERESVNNMLKKYGFSNT